MTNLAARLMIDKLKWNKSIARQMTCTMMNLFDTINLSRKKTWLWFYWLVCSSFGLTVHKGNRIFTWFHTLGCQSGDWMNMRSTASDALFNLSETSISAQRVNWCPYFQTIESFFYFFFVSVANSLKTQNTHPQSQRNEMKQVGDSNLCCIY